MIYVMSDIHGDYVHLRRMLQKIRYAAGTDFLYILGDVIDKGKENLRTLQAVRDLPGAVLLKGNHEYLCERYLKHIVSAALWDRCAGRETRMEVDDLSREEQAGLCRYLEELPVCCTVHAGGEDYFLTHSGFYADEMVTAPDGRTVDIEASVRQAVRADQERYLFSDDIHVIPASLKFDKKIIVGHRPTMTLPDFQKPEIYHGTQYTDIDTGNENRRGGGRLACLRLDDGQEYYI